MTQDNSAIALLLGFTGVVVVICLAIWILTIIAKWKIFTKAGIAGWKSIIPIYSDYCTFKIAWETKYFWIFLIATAGMSFFQNSYSHNGQSSMSLIGLAFGLVAIVFGFLLSVNLAKKFGYGLGFGIGLMLLSTIFQLILGFGSSVYQGNPAEGLYGPGGNDTTSTPTSDINA